MGSDPAHDPEKVHAVSGVVTEHAMMYDNMTGTDNLIFYGSLFGLSPPEEAKDGQRTSSEALICPMPEGKSFLPIPPECARGFPLQERLCTVPLSSFSMSRHQASTLKAPRMSTI